MTDKLPNPQDLFSPKFWTISHDRAYTAAGSLVGFLLRTYQPQEVIDVYDGKPLAQAFSTPFSTIVQQWSTYVKSQYQQSSDDLLGEFLYSEASTFDDICPHSKQDLKPATNVFEQWLQPSQWQQQDYRAWKHHLNPHDKWNTYENWQQIAQKMVAQQTIDATTVSLWQSQLSPPINSLEDVYLLLLVADIKSIFHIPTHKEWAQLTEALSQKNLGESLERQILARKLIQTQIPQRQQRSQWLRYVAGWGPLPQTQLQPDQKPIIQYLILRNKGAEAASLAVLQQLMQPPNLPRPFIKEWYQALARSYFEREQYQLSAKAWDQTAAYSGTAAMAYYAQQARMMHYFDQKSLGSNQ